MTENDPDPMQKPRRLILASASPRRVSLMREHGYDVEVMEPPVEEPKRLPEDVSPAGQAEALSYFKAQSVARLAPDAWVIAGDTIVTLEGRLFGKPADRDDARRILSMLAGTTHEVITGVTLLHASSNDRWIDHDTTAVTMRAITREELDAYLDSGAWAGKAGAYGIQDRGDAFIERIDGSFTNVVGFPMELVARLLGGCGILPSTVQRPPSDS
jgi:septum formation protein